MADLQCFGLSIEEGIATIKINRPPVNAINHQFLDELDQLITGLQSERSAKVIILASAIQNVFVAGIDLKEVAQFKTAEDAAKLIRRGQDVFTKIENSEKPVIAAIQGACLGGGHELAMACHIRIASDRTRLAQPEVMLGIIPGFGGSQRLPRIVGAARATEIMLTGDPITPQEAFRMGLVNRVVSDGALLKTAREIAKKIARNSLPAIQATMRAMRKGLDATLEEGMKAEEAEFRSIFGTNDMKEGVRAFIEKRQPKFTDS